MPRCSICLALLRQALELSHRAQAIDGQAVLSVKAARGCATPALAILNRYDADLEGWQKRVADHLASGEHA